MTYESEEIEYSQKIFYYLLKNKELKEDGDRELYRAYTEREQVMALVKQQAGMAECEVER